MQKIGINKLRYWYDKPVTVDGKQLVEVYVQGQGLCAKGQLLIADTSKQSRLVRYDGEGYHGAELKQVEITISKDSESTNFILENVGEIVD